MFIFANLIEAVAKILEILLTIYYWLILVRALISWVNPDPYNPLVQFLHKATEPVLSPIRKILPLGYRIGIDLSPLIAFFLIIFLRSFLIKTLMQISFYLR
ncbi:MAG: YggT family protein [Candidatus Saelkia tenebricola]|nr:YggT family protein [Candidatus Saelkia tenebricola]